MIQAEIERCAGIDIGKNQLSVCLMTGPLDAEPRVEKREYGTTTAELERLRAWFQQEAVTHVVMESTGSYWKPVFNVLEEAVCVYLANPQEVKNRKGHKTDRKDGWWLAHLLRHAMIHPSFIPARGLRELRDLTRRRRKLLGDATSEKNRVEKVLQDANVKLSSALSDLFGVSGQLMLEALLEGKAPPEQIAQLARGRAQVKVPELIRSLEGHRMRAHHRRMIRFSLEHLRFLEEQIGELDEAIAAQIEELGLVRQWELLQTVPAIQATSAATVLAEIGSDMRQFPSERHLASWAGVCPGNNESAGKKKSARPNRGNRYLKAALVQPAWNAARKKDCFLKDKFWRLTSKHNHKKQPAVVAVAHTLLMLIYRVLKTGEPYRERADLALEPKRKEQIIRHHLKRLGKLGVRVRPYPEPTLKGRANTSNKGT